MLVTYLKQRGREDPKISGICRQGKIKIMVIVQKKILAQLLSPTLSMLPNTYLKKVPLSVLLLTKGYDIASRQPVARQERNQDSKANQRKEKVQQPGSNLEKVQRPAPAIPSSTLDLHLRKSFTQVFWSCLIRRFIADIHLYKTKKYVI